MESTQETVEEYTESDGTKVVKRTIIKRTKPVGAGNQTTRTIMTTSGPNAHSTLDVADPRSMSKVETDFLNKHNEYRSKHGVAPLKLSRELCNYAQEWATKIAAQNKMQHRPDNKYGENIFWKSGTNVTLTGDEPVTKWYSEIKDYNKSWYGNEPPRNTGTGHFTQVVWKGSERVGVGIGVNGSQYYVVANYDPPGNYISHYANNVLKPK